jgi:hypothetical protein
MKKYLWLFGFLLSSTNILGAQSQWGVQIVPGLSYNRLHTNPDTTNLTSDGFGLSLRGGLIYDHCFKEYYYISTGLIFAVKRCSVQHTQSNIKELHTLQYLQVPLLFKLYTGEIALDTQMYVELGAVGAMKINSWVSELSAQQVFITKFKPWEVGGVVGIGVTYNISLFTSIFAGLSYQLGLSSMVDTIMAIEKIPNVESYSDYLGLEFGIKV